MLKGQSSLRPLFEYRARCVVCHHFNFPSGGEGGRGKSSLLPSCFSLPLPFLRSSSYCLFPLWAWKRKKKKDKFYFRDFSKTDRMSFIVNNHQDPRSSRVCLGWFQAFGTVVWNQQPVSLGRERDQPCLLLTARLLDIRERWWGGCQKTNSAYTSRQPYKILLPHVWMANDVEITRRLMLRGIEAKCNRSYRWSGVCRSFTKWIHPPLCCPGSRSSVYKTTNQFGTLRSFSSSTRHDSIRCDGLSDYIPCWS